MLVVRSTLTALTLFALLASTSASGVTINFDDGIEGNAIGDFYQSLGVTFLNAEWSTNNVDTIYLNGEATAPYSISSISSGRFYSSADPMIVQFSTPQTLVQILGVNVGFAGARIEAYDSLIGGSLIDFDEAFGTTEKGQIDIGGGFLEHEEFLLSVAGTNITRIELFRPVHDANDGVHFDNLQFGLIPVPGPAPLMMLVLGIFYAARYRASRAAV